MGYVNNPPTAASGITHYVNNPASNLSPATHYINSPLSTGVPLPPGAPLLSYLGDNTDGFGNTLRLDGVAFSPWKNLGSKASSDLSQLAMPVWRAIGGVGKLNNMPAVSASAGQYLAIDFAGANLSQPLTYGIIWMTTDQTTTEVMCEGSLELAHIGPAIWMIGGGVNQNTGLNCQSNKWHMLTCEFNGASSFARLDGVPSSTFNVGANQLVSFSLFAQASGGIPLTGRIAECQVYAQAGQSAASLEAYYTDKYGGFPQ